MLYRAEKPSLATAMSVWKDKDSRPDEDWISGGILVPQYRPIRGDTAMTQTEINYKQKDGILDVTFKTEYI